MEHFQETPELRKLLDVTKTAAFLGSNAAFLGSIMCSLQFVWDTDTKTAATDGITLFWNPVWFMGLTPETRKSVLLHELWHVARLHSVRGSNYDPAIWNEACDYRINNDMVKDGYKFDGVDPLLNPDFDYPVVLAEEEIYALLQTGKAPRKTAGWGLDVLPCPTGQVLNATAVVVRAMQQAHMSGQHTDLPESIKDHIAVILTPVVPWEQELYAFFNDLADKERTWSRPNRRYTEMYMPSYMPGKNRLEHLMYFLDVSGSITRDQIIRFNSEVAYIQNSLKPKKLTLVQFDVRISDVTVYEENDEYEFLDVIGGGGTSLKCVRQYIEEHSPTAVVVFSDMHCTPMEPLSSAIPVIWAVVGNKKVTPAFGKVVHVM